jgi:hypothetical protein
MNKRLPADALGYYLNLGAARSYQAVAEHFGVSKRTVTTAATRERWQEHLDESQRKAQEKIGESYVDAIAQANERHVKLGRFLQSQGVSALRSGGVLSSGDRIRAIKVGVEIERLGLGEPTERLSTSVEEIIKREFAICMRDDEEEGEPGAPESNGVDGASDSPGDDFAIPEGAAAPDETAD